MRKYAFVIGNDGLGDMISYYGIVKYLSTLYKVILVSCEKRNYENMKFLYEHDNIKLYVFNKSIETNIYEFCKNMLYTTTIFDVYPIGNYGALSLNINNYTKIMPNGTTKK